MMANERRLFEAFMAERFGDCIDQRQVKNGDGEYFAWDMQVAWLVWQHRAGLPHHLTNTPCNTCNDGPRGGCSACSFNSK